MRSYGTPEEPDSEDIESRIAISLVGEEEKDEYPEGNHQRRRDNSEGAFYGSAILVPSCESCHWYQMILQCQWSVIYRATFLEPSPRRRCPWRRPMTCKSKYPTTRRSDSTPVEGLKYDMNHLQGTLKLRCFMAIASLYLPYK